MTTTDQQARAIAYLLHEIRPDWGITSLETLIRTNQPQPLGPLIIAATTKAMEATCKTPAPIFHPGPHWPAKAKTTGPRAEPCPTHIGESSHNCRCCAADRKAAPPEHESEN